MGTKSSKHARKVKLDSSINNAIAHAVDARKVASFTASAAGVIAGAALALGTTPAVAVSSNAMQSGNAQNVQSNLNNDQSDSGVDANGSDSASTYSDRSSSPAPAPKVNSEITLSEETKDTLPNLYAWGSSDNVYIEKGQSQEVTFKFAKPTDGSTITKVAIFPTDTNGVENTKSRGYLEYYSADAQAHKPYSGTYEFIVNTDGSAKLTMTKLYRNANMAAEKYAANRCIYVYGIKDGKESVLYKTNIVRAATLVPPKTAGSIVLKYNEKLTEQRIQDKLKAALDAPTEATGKKSVRDQIVAASKAFGVGGRTGENNKFVQTPDDPENKVIINDQRAYNRNDITSLNTATSKPGATETTYTPTVRTLKTHLITDTGYTSDDLPLTVARYDTRIDKPIVEDPTKVSDDVKTDIKKKLSQLNHVPQDSVVISDDGTVTINFNGVDPQDAPKIPLRNLVLKKLEEADVNVPTGDKAVFVANPLGYSKAELDRIKTAILDANKDNEKLGLTSKDQITLSYVMGDLTGAGDANKGRSNGLQENNINVTIKTDKALAEFTSDIIKDKLTRLPDIRNDYKVELVKNKLDGRDSDEGFSWSDDKHTTLIYRYDPTKAQAFTAPEIVKLIKATPKDQKTGLRPLTGGEALDHEGTGGKARKSHMGYAIDKNGEPTTELTLGMMNGAYWIGNPQVDNSDVNMGDEESKVGQYTWDTEAGSVTVAAKQNKVFKTRLFVAPYALTYYRGVYTDPYKKNPNNTPKAINVIFVPQTNHKTNDLKKSVLGHKTTNIEGNEVPTDSAYYNASDKVKKDYEDALNVAKQTLEKVGTTTDDKLSEQLKAEVDNATIKLDKARKALDGAKTDKNGLNASIEADGKAAEGANPASGTQATNQFKNVSDPDFKTDDGKPDTAKNEKAKAAKKAYDEALEKAKTVTADDNATQKAVDDAKAKLDAAREKLNEFSTNKDALNAAIAVHGHVYEYTNDNLHKLTVEDKLKKADPTYKNSSNEEREKYDNALEEAIRLSADPNASQKEVNEAIAALEKAKKALDAKATDKAPLDAAVQKSLDKDPTKHSVFYTNAKNKTGDTAAQQAVKNYDDALAEAKRVLGDKNATKDDVDKAKKALEDAEKVLYAETYQTKATDLAEAIADNFSGYLMPAYFNAFDKAQAEGKDSQAAKDFKAYNDAYHAAKDLMDELNKPGSTVDQNKVDAVKKQLLDARKIIDTYATDTSRLSAAVFNDIAIKNSPAYKNLKALAEKTNPTPEEQADVEAAKKAMEAYKKAAEKLHNAITNKLPRDTANGQDIPDKNIPEKNGDLNDSKYLDNIQAHKNGEPLDRDVDAILKEMNAAAAELNKFATKTDDLLKSINEDAATHQNPAFKNASHPDYKQADGTTADDAKNTAAKNAVDEYGKALNEAKDLLKNPSATQKQVNDAKDKLDKARAELNKYNTDITKLKDSVDKHGNKQDSESTAAKEGTVTSDAYRNASDPHFLTADGKPDEQKNTQAAADKKAYDDALTKAQELLKKHDDANTPQDAKPTQADIDAALNNLDAARKKLEDNYKTDTTKLDEEAKKSTAEGAQTVGENDFENTPEFKNAKAKTSDGQTNADVAAYQKALKKARDLVKAAADQGKKNSERPTQQQINEALDALKAAKKQITDNYKTNLEPLTSAKDFAGGDFKKTPEYLNAVAKKDAGDQGATQALGEAGQGTGFDNVLKKVADKLNDDTWKAKATQKEVNALLKQLKDAQDNIAKKYKTDAIKLEREVGDKDQDGNPVVPPFEASVAYKNALEKANAGDNDATAKLKEYTEKLKAAQELVNKVNNPDPNAKPEERPTQKQVDEALAALKKAKQDIDDNFKTKVDDLQKEADDKDDKGVAKNPTFENTTEFANLKDMTKDGNKPDDLVAYEKALEKAKELIDKNDGKVKNADGQEVDVPKDQLPSQKEVDDALQTLKKIKEKILANYKTKVNDLKTEAAKSKDENSTPGSSTTPSTDTKFEDSAEFKNADAKKGEGGKENADVTAYKEALKKARTLLNKFDENGKPKQGETSIPTQKEVDAALDALKAAKKKITDSYKTDKSALKSETDKDSDFKKSVAFMIGRKDDIDAYKKALEEAKKVLNDPNATQAQVDAALKALQDAKNRIISYYGVGGIYDSSAVDKSELQKEVNNSGDASAKANAHADSAAAKAYKKALANAQRVLADPNATQAQVDAALKALRDAKAALQDYANSSSQNNANGKLPNTGLNATFFASFSALFAAMGIGIVSTRRKHSKR